VGLLLVLLCNTGCGAGNDFNARLNTVVSPYRFSIARWEFNTWFTQFKQLFGKHAKITGTDTEITDHYIALSNQINDLKSSINDANRTTVQAQIDTLQQQQNSITGTVENIIKRQTAQVLMEVHLPAAGIQTANTAAAFGNIAAGKDRAAERCAAGRKSECCRRDIN
jgi:hypothetical protein